VFILYNLNTNNEQLQAAWLKHVMVARNLLYALGLYRFKELAFFHELYLDDVPFPPMLYRQIDATLARRVFVFKSTSLSI
jgi:hypothetical protein